MSNKYHGNVEAGKEWRSSTMHPACWNSKCVKSSGKRMFLTKCWTLCPHSVNKSPLSLCCSIASLWHPHRAMCASSMPMRQPCIAEATHVSPWFGLQGFHDTHSDIQAAHFMHPTLHVQKITSQKTNKQGFCSVQVRKGPHSTPLSEHFFVLALS